MENAIIELKAIVVPERCLDISVSPSYSLSLIENRISGKRDTMKQAVPDAREAIHQCASGPWE
jgi:hypothetical protein